MKIINNELTRLTEVFPSVLTSTISSTINQLLGKFAKPEQFLSISTVGAANDGYVLSAYQPFNSQLTANDIAIAEVVESYENANKVKLDNVIGFSMPDCFFSLKREDENVLVAMTYYDVDKRNFITKSAKTSKFKNLKAVLDGLEKNELMEVNMENKTQVKPLVITITSTEELTESETTPTNVAASGNTPAETDSNKESTTVKENVTDTKQTASETESTEDVSETEVETEADTDTENEEDTDEDNTESEDFADVVEGSTSDEEDDDFGDYDTFEEDETETSSTSSNTTVDDDDEFPFS